jgi:hypothetical protein
MQLKDNIDWRQVELLPHLWISSEGQVYSTKTNRILKNRICGHEGNGYYAIAYRRNGRTANMKIHRLVAEYFIPNPENKPFVNHKDGNKFNNHKDNLEWVTCSENILHAINTGLNPKRGNNNHNSKIPESEINRIIDLHKAGFYQSSIAKLFKVHQSTINRIVNNKTYKTFQP